MSLYFRELDNQDTPLGELSLRVRQSISVPDRHVYEVSLNGEFLMSSLVNDSECALATLALEQLDRRPCDVLVGGLGLGYTAAAALAYEEVLSVRVVELLEPVIQWHQNRLIPAAHTLLDDPRCEIFQADFYEHVGEDLPHRHPGRYDAILLDIDHSPEALLSVRHGAFYTEAGLKLMCRHLRAGGVFGLWSAEPPADAFIALLRKVFCEVRLHNVEFYNPLHGRVDVNTVTIAKVAADR